MDKKTMTVKELQEYLGIGRVLAYTLCSSEGFPTIRVGKKVLISVDGLNEWIKKGGNKNISIANGKYKR